MKRFIFSALAFVLAVFGTASFANAQSFNNDPRDMQTVLVAKGSCTAGGVNGCWQPTVTAAAGETVAVHLYYHNTGSSTVNNVSVALSPQSTGVGASHNMQGAILVNGAVIKTGSAIINVTSPAALTLIDVKWFPNQTTTGQLVSSSAVFSSGGMSVGNLAPGWGAQGSVVARYRVGDATQTTYQCNDGIDNDGDGRVDYPSDPGCSSSTDNDEYNQVTQTYQCNDGFDNDGDGRIDYPSDSGCYGYTDNYEGDDTGGQCMIDSFYASPTYVTSGGYTTLYWNTTGCDQVTIDGVTYPVDGSGSFGPIYSSRNYVLQGLRNGLSQTRSVFVSVNQNPVYTYQCNDGFDNDGDGRIDYPSDSGCSTYNDDSEYNQTSNTQPQAVTTVATINSSTSARLNGIAVPNYSGNSTAWFEWGTSGSLGTRTNAQTITNSGSSYYSDLVSGLTPGAVYYYRAVVQNTNGIAYGDIVRFQTQQTTVNPPTRVITRTVVQRERDVVVAQSAPSLLELRVENVYDRMCIGGDMEYTVTYRNISTQTLQNAVLRVVHPKELTFINASRGDYEVVDRALTLPLGDLSAGETGSIVIRARVNNEAIRGNVAVLTAQVVYTNTNTKAQEDAIAYSLITVSEDCPNLLGASAFGIGSFFPNSLLGWLILILVILALIVLGRQLYKKKA